MRRNTCRSDGRRCRSCAGRRGAVCSTRSTHHRPAACGGGRSTSGCCATDVKRSHSWAGWPASRRRMPCGSGWSSARNRRGATGTELTTRASSAGYLEYRDLAEAESAPERFFMNVALARVLYAHALNAAPRLALGRSLRSAACSATPGSGWRASFSPYIACYRPVIHSRSTFESYRRRTTSRPTARLRSACPSATARCTSGRPMSSPSRGCSSSFATATRSMPGLTRSDMCGARAKMPFAGPRTRTRHAGSLKMANRNPPLRARRLR